MKTSRRDFLVKTGLALGATSFLGPSVYGNDLNNIQSPRSYGFQIWPIRKALVEDFAGTLKKMADIGYKEVEMCSPLGYSMIGLKPLNDMTGKNMRTIIEDQGLVCRSCHYTKGELKDNLEDRIEWSVQMGITQIILSTFWLPGDATIDDYRKAADELNVAAEKIKQAGIQTGFHNHHFEFKKIGDVLIYDALMDQFDPDLVKMQFQVAVVDIGYKAADYFRKYPGRFISAHLADWSKEKDANVSVGEGDVDWEDFFEAAKAGGVENYFVEMDPEMMEKSIGFLLKQS